METTPSIRAGISDACILLGGQPRSGTTLFSSILRCTTGHFQAFELHLRKPSFIAGLEGRYTRNIFGELGLDPEVYRSIIHSFDRTAEMNLGAWVGPREEVSAEELTGTETANFAGELHARCELVTRLMQEVARVQGVKSWGFKILGDVVYADRLFEVWPQARMLLLVRDPRDQILSLMALNEQRQERGQRLFYEEIATAANGWRTTIEGARLAALRAGTALIEFKYEDLVFEPEATLTRLSSQLDLGLDLTSGLSFQDEEFVDQQQVRFKHHGNLKNPINPSSVGKWRTEFSSEDVKIIERETAPLFAEFGYE